MVGKVYHSSKGEVACLVKDECYLTDTDFYGNEETMNEVSNLTNKEILNLWKKNIEV
jgi:enamine deaminase RidA (YjgF/YER057c/UK114 family)